MPTATFNATVDSVVQKSAGTYPPGGTAARTSNAQDLRPQRTLSGGTHFIVNAFLTFDTSTLPDNATVTAATLRIYVDLNDSANARNLTADWYLETASSSTDYSETAQTNAHTGTAITSLTLNADNDLALSNVSNVSLTGNTGLRLHVDGGQPTGVNRPRIQAIEHATLPEARLIVTYTVPSTIEFVVGMVGM